MTNRDEWPRQTCGRCGTNPAEVKTWRAPGEHLCFRCEIANKNLWVDDIREPPTGWAWAKTSSQALTMIEEYGPYDTISFDHDLGGDDTTRPIVLWMSEHDRWPFRVRVHTANPVGREWLTGMIGRYGPGVTA